MQGCQQIDKSCRGGDLTTSPFAAGKVLGVRLPCPNCNTNAGVVPCFGYTHGHKLSFVEGLTTSEAIVGTRNWCCNPECPENQPKIAAYLQRWETEGTTNGLRAPPSTWTAETAFEWGEQKTETLDDGSKKNKITGARYQMPGAFHCLPLHAFHCMPFTACLSPSFLSWTVSFSAFLCLSLHKHQMSPVFADIFSTARW